MIGFFKNRTNHLHKLEEYIISLDYTVNNLSYIDLIPSILYTESNFRVIGFENQSIGKSIEIYLTSKNTIASLILFDFNHSTPAEQYCNPQLMTSLGRLDKEEFNHFETFGFEKFGKKEFDRTVKLIEKNINYFITPKKFPIGNLKKYPGFTDLCNIKFNLNEVMINLEYKLIIDGSKYNPKFTKPNLWYKKGDTEIKFVRRKSKDENYIYAVIGHQDISKNFFHYGTYEAGKQFSEKEWEVIKDKLKIALNDDQIFNPSL